MIVLKVYAHYVSNNNKTSWGWDLPHLLSTSHMAIITNGMQANDTKTEEKKNTVITLNTLCNLNLYIAMIIYMLLVYSILNNDSYIILFFIRL